PGGSPLLSSFISPPSLLSWSKLSSPGFTGLPHALLIFLYQESCKLIYYLLRIGNEEHDQEIAVVQTTFGSHYPRPGIPACICSRLSLQLGQPTCGQPESNRSVHAVIDLHHQRYDEPFGTGTAGRRQLRRNVWIAQYQLRSPHDHSR